MDIFLLANSTFMEPFDPFAEGAALLLLLGYWTIGILLKIQEQEHKGWCSP